MSYKEDVKIAYDKFIIYFPDALLKNGLEITEYNMRVMASIMLYTDCDEQTAAERLIKGDIMTEEQKKEIESLKWWHRILLDEITGYTTPGICSHGHPGDFETRFGLPKDLTGLTVLDVGGYDGLFSFECEKRGAKEITMIDYYQGSPNTWPNDPFQLAKKILNSKVGYKKESLESFAAGGYRWDYILYYGVMYHIENPLGAVKKLMTLVKPGGTVLVETAISNPELEASLTPVLEFRPGFDGDPTNFFYPNTAWIEFAFMTSGAKSVQVVYKDSLRATYRINC